MKIAKILGLLLLVIVSLFIFVANFSVVSSKYKCTGEISLEGNKESKTLFIVLAEYQWWVGLWSDSDGNVQLEIPNNHVGYYSHVVDVGNQRQIYDSPNEMKGNFSTLSKTLSLKTPYGFFDGKCVDVR
jgi:hypothetical protein